MAGPVHLHGCTIEKLAFWGFDSSIHENECCLTSIYLLVRYLIEFPGFLFMFGVITIGIFILFQSHQQQPDASFGLARPR